MGLAESSVSTRTVPRFTSAVTRGLRESAVIALGIVALVLFVALATYSPDDPGFSFTGTAAVIHNRIGVVGAWLADVLFFLFGRPAYLFPAVLAAAAFGMQRRMKTPAPASRANALVRLAGFLLVLVASCGLATLHWQPGVLRQSAGARCRCSIPRRRASCRRSSSSTIRRRASRCIPPRHWKRCRGWWR